MYEKILVPLDGSKRAEMIRPHVRELASRFKATVILIKVIDYNTAYYVKGKSSNSTWEEVIKAKLKRNKLYLDGVAAKLKDKGISCETLVAQGPVVEKIIEAANKENVDLIAMTSHGYGGLTRIFYGSVAAGILNRVDRPLFIVRSQWDE
jgi:nucleotide-binding universal stress UspA family protein